jgi:Protein of unknown function (DUF3891)
MVLYPLDTASDENTSDPTGEGHPANGPNAPASRISVWEAVERRQKQTAQTWWLVAQPDHAALSGDLAASISSSSHFPKLDSEVLAAIRLHDEGWAQVDAADGGGSKSQSRTSESSESARPLSFLDMSPSVFIRAWKDSIRRAEESSALGGILVSEHFSRLAKSRLQSCIDTFQDMENLRRFLGHEAEQRRRLMAKTGRSDEETRSLVDVLQFCDLLSLYLCCGAVEDVEFPQQVQGRTIVLRRAGEMCRTDPAIFGAGVSLGVSARRHPQSEAEVNVITMGFLLA